MTHGLPDDANVLGYVDMSRSDDVTELAARLGAPIAYERRGNVLYVTSFANGAASWIAERLAVDESPTLSGDYSIVGGVSLEIATTDENAETMELYRDLPLFSDAYYGVFAMLSLDPDTYRLYINAYVYDGVTRWEYRLEVSPLDSTLKYRVSGGAYVTLDDALNVFASIEHFHSLGLIFDTENDVWREVTFDGVTYDVSNIAPPTTEDATAPRLRVSFEVISDGANQASSWLDSVVVAQNPTVVN